MWTIYTDKCEQSVNIEKFKKWTLDLKEYLKWLLQGFKWRVYVCLVKLKVELIICGFHTGY